ncbi:MAG: prohead protease/major capsid protein fusion protein [Mesorhizobium sp.]
MAWLDPPCVKYAPRGNVFGHRLALLAGPAAERWSRGRQIYRPHDHELRFWLEVADGDLPPNSPDCAQFFSVGLSEHPGLSPEEHISCYRMIDAEAVAFVTSGPAWNAIRAVATSLEGKGALTGDEIRALASPFIALHRPADRRHAMNAPVTIDLPAQRRSASVRAASFDEATNTIEIVFTSGASVRRHSWIDGPYIEELVVTAQAVKLDRLNLGAPFLDTHDSYDLSRVLGSVVPGSARIERGKGICRVLLSDAEDVASSVQKIREGTVKNISVGYKIIKVEKTEAAAGEIPVHRVVEWEPLEVSAVPIPADPNAQVRAEGRQTYQATIINRSTKEAPMPTKNTALASDDAATAELERARCGAIADLGQRFGVADLAADAIREGTNLADFRRQLIDRMADDERRAHPGGPGHQTGAPMYATVGDNSREGARAAGVQAAILHRISPEEFPLAAGGEAFMALPMLELARQSLEVRGVRTAGMSKMQIAGEALAQRSGLHSTADFPHILANVAGKVLRQAYEAAPATWRPLARVTTVPDFKEQSRVSIGEAPAFEKVNEAGEFKRGTMGESNEKYAIATYGRVVSLTRQAIINDDLNAFSVLPRAFGIQAAQLESDVVWAQILSNPTMGDGKTLFHADHKNLGTDLAIGKAAVSEARLKMGLQTGLDGKTVLNLSPSFIIVPKALQTDAEEFLAAIYPTKSSDAVPLALKALTPIAEPRLDAGILRFGIAGDANAFYFAASTATVDLIEVAYLEGAQGVYIETRQGFDVDGVEVKCRLDVGAKAIDWRGFVKTPYDGPSGG